MGKLRPGRFGDAVKISAFMVGALFLIFLLEVLFPAQVGILGIRPRTVPGLVGIIFAPVLHGSGAHLMANAPPLFVLLILLFWDKHYRPWETLILIWVASGVGTWLIGRGATEHIGASSVIYGLAMYIIVSGFVMRSWRGFFFGVLVILVYGGIFFGVLPQKGSISWEGHLSGTVAGIWAARRNHIKS